MTSPATPLCVLAGAGSGKTKVLTHRIAYRAAEGTADPAHTLALTFTRKAAGELRARLGALGLRAPVAAGTFHGVAFAQLRQIWMDRGQRPLVLLERRPRLLGPIVVASAGSSHQAIVADVAAEIAWAKARVIGPHAYAEAAREAGRKPALSPDSVAEVFDQYEQHKRRRGLLDLDDVLVQCAEAIENDPEVAATQRWRWRHVFVDEYQDLNPAHARLIDAWLGTSLDLCVVGDPNQAIYEWNGSDPSLLTGFPRRYPSAEVVTLSDNYRSSTGVVAVAGAALGAPAVPTAHGRDGPVPVLRSYASDAEEATGIAQALRDLHPPGTSWSRLAVLTRTNVQLRAISNALANAGVPHRIQGGRPLALHPALAALLAAPGDRPASSLEGELRLLLASGSELRHAGTPPRGEGTRSGRFTSAALGRQQLRGLHAGLRALREYLDLDRSGSIAGFVAWLEASDLSWEDAQRDAAVLSTFHRAKGLEWPVVFVAGLEEGLVPLTRAAGNPPVAEERRLLYVALTRAGNDLRCSWARRRRFGSRVVERSPSPFLPALEHAIAALDTDRAAIDPRPALRSLRQTLAAGPPGSRPRAIAGHPGQRDPGTHLNGSAAAAVSALPTAPGSDLLDDLRRWRETVARASRVAPGAVITDRTLAAVASCPPRAGTDLVALPGLGPVAARRWGPALLAVIARHTGGRPSAAPPTGRRD